MRRLGPIANAVAAIVVALGVMGAGLASNVAAQTTPDRSDVVLVFDFSASILEDATTRNRFGAALERIAARVDETSADLVAGDLTRKHGWGIEQQPRGGGPTQSRLLSHGGILSRHGGLLSSALGPHEEDDGNQGDRSGERQDCLENP